MNSIRNKDIGIFTIKGWDAIGSSYTKGFSQEYRVFLTCVISLVLAPTKGLPIFDQNKRS
jgi:hypothetical protein